MAIKDANLYFTGYGTSGYAPTANATENIAPFTIDTSPLGLPTGSGGSASIGYNAGASVNAGRDLGIGGEMWWEVLVTVAVAQTSGGAIFYLVTDATATMASVASQTGVGVLLGSPNLTAAKLIAGATYRSQLPQSATYLQFLGMDVYIFTNNWTAGTVESSLVMNVQASDLYLSGFAVS